jgi:hypothetical protein
MMDVYLRFSFRKGLTTMERLPGDLAGEGSATYRLFNLFSWSIFSWSLDIISLTSFTLKVINSFMKFKTSRSESAYLKS